LVAKQNRTNFFSDYFSDLNESHFFLQNLAFSVMKIGAFEIFSQRKSLEKKVFFSSPGGLLHFPLRRFNDKFL